MRVQTAEKPLKPREDDVCVIIHEHNPTKCSRLTAGDASRRGKHTVRARRGDTAAIRQSTDSGSELTTRQTPLQPAMRARNGIVRAEWSIDAMHKRSCRECHLYKAGYQENHLDWQRHGRCKIMCSCITRILVTASLRLNLRTFGLMPSTTIFRHLRMDGE